jgi:hypothetical protein
MLWQLVLALKLTHMRFVNIKNVEQQDIQE